MCVLPLAIKWEFKQGPDSNRGTFQFLSQSLSNSAAVIVQCLKSWGIAAPPALTKWPYDLNMASLCLPPASVARQLVSNFIDANEDVRIH